MFGDCPGCSACGCGHLVFASPRQHHLPPLSPPPVQHCCSYLRTAASSPALPLPRVRERLIFPMWWRDDNRFFSTSFDFSCLCRSGDRTETVSETYTLFQITCLLYTYIQESVLSGSEASLLCPWTHYRYIQKCLHLPAPNLGECVLASSWSKAVLVPTFAHVAFTAASRWQFTTARALLRALPGFERTWPKLFCSLGFLFCPYHSICFSVNLSAKEQIIRLYLKSKHMLEYNKRRSILTATVELD